MIVFLVGLFVLRVLAQFIQAIYPLPFIPAFAAWHGAVIPYPVLVVIQLLIVLAMAIVLLRLRAGAIVPRRWKYRMCFALGGAYFAFMAFRLITGLTLLSDNAWFAKSLPAFFHLVLASFILFLAFAIYQKAALTASDGNDPVAAKEKPRG